MAILWSCMLDAMRFRFSTVVLYECLELPMSEVVAKEKPINMNTENQPRSSLKWSPITRYPPDYRYETTS